MVSIWLENRSCRGLIDDLVRCNWDGACYRRRHVRSASLKVACEDDSDADCNADVEMLVVTESGQRTARGRNQCPDGDQDAADHPVALDAQLPELPCRVERAADDNERP